MSKRFTYSEAQVKIGTRVRTLVKFAGVLKGTTGTVTADSPMGKFNTELESGYEYDVVIQWDIRSRSEWQRNEPLQDWFNKYDYERYLEEVGESDPIDVFVREALLNKDAMGQPGSFIEEDADAD